MAGDPMKVYIIGDNAFIELVRDTDYMLCIGTKAEVDAADDKEIVRMVLVALAQAEYRSLTGKEVKN